jgi:hypothetical protein
MVWRGMERRNWKNVDFAMIDIEKKGTRKEE